MAMLRILLLIQGILTLAFTVGGQTYTDETELRSNLSSGYNRFVRPSSPTVVTIFYSIRALQHLISGISNIDLNNMCALARNVKSVYTYHDITEQEITITGWMTLYWNDPRLTWDNSTTNITALEINWGWRPEFVISNSGGEFTTFGLDNDSTRMRVYSDGHVRWNPLMISTTMCNVDISKFPFDTQTCDVDVVLWSYSFDEVTLNSLYKEIQQVAYLENAEWVFEGSEITDGDVRLCCPTTSGEFFRISLTFSRRRQFYVMNLIFPTVLLSGCLVWAFILPTESGERLGFALTILLAYTVQMSITAQLMPTTSKQVPFIAQYLLIVLVLCSVVTCNVVLHVKLFYLQEPVYEWLKIIYQKVHPIVFLTCCFNRKKGKNDNSVADLDFIREKTNASTQKIDLSESVVVPEANGDKNHVTSDDVTWADVSVFLDRVCFFMYLIAISTVNGVFLNSIS